MRSDGMKIVMVETKTLAGEVFAEGQTYDISEGQAQTWIDNGTAKPAIKPPAKKRKEDDS